MQNLKEIADNWLRRVFNTHADPFDALKKRLSADNDFKQWSENTQVRDDAGRPEIVFHATRMPIDKFWPLSHFGTSEAADNRVSKSGVEYSEGTHFYPVCLNITNPLELPDRGNHDSKAFKMLMEEAGILSQNEIDYIFDRSVDPQLGEVATPKSLDIFAPESREQMRGFITNELDRYVAAHEESVAELKEKDYFDETGMTPKNIWKQRLCEALREKGYDGIKYVNTEEDKGSVSWVVFHHSQVYSPLAGDTLKHGDKSAMWKKLREEAMQVNHIFDRSNPFMVNTGGTTPRTIMNEAKIRDMLGQPPKK